MSGALAFNNNELKLSRKLTVHQTLKALYIWIVLTNPPIAIRIRHYFQSPFYKQDNCAFERIHCYLSLHRNDKSWVLLFTNIAIDLITV